MSDNEMPEVVVQKKKKDKKRKRVESEVKIEAEEQEVEVKKEVSKKKKNAEKVKVEEVEGEDVAPERKNRKEQETEQKGFRKSKYGQNIGEVQEDKFMSLEDCLKQMSKYRGKSKGGAIVKKRLLRHISLPFHMSSDAAMKRATDFLAQNTVGKYKKAANGVVIKVGDIEIVSDPRIISDQNVFHWDVYINQIVFTPKKGDVYEAVVQYSVGGMIIGTVMGLISVFVQENKKTKQDEVGVEDRIMVKYASMKIKSSLCQLHGTYEKMIAKAQNVKEDVDEYDPEDTTIEPKVEMEEGEA